MFLKQMKIIGFKSFVEPAVLHFKTNRAAVVGPNGCGKSNVIDAIRWVMGESSAKFLRGDIMSDVIFNGSLQRKPVGMASVEIILDNTNGYLQGAYVRKADVALRREINRSGESHYFINNQKVRRRDLTDLWLGTGAGSRGYAIIGQNMVNQLVEANPDALKAYLEEAAGVSKYKERRKESVERLLTVSDNLSRIADISLELSQSLERLEKEAKDAHLYQSYRQDSRILQEKLQLLHAKQVVDKQEELEKLVHLQNSLEKKLEQESFHAKHELDEFDMRLNQYQEDIKNQEQSLFQQKIELQQQAERLNQIQKDKERYRKEQEHAQLELIQVQNRYNQNTQEWIELDLQLKSMQDDEHLSQNNIQTLKNQVVDLKNQIKEKHFQKNQIRQKIQEYFTQSQVLNVKLEQAIQDISVTKDRMDKFKAESNHQQLHYLKKSLSFLEDEHKPMLLACEDLKHKVFLGQKASDDSFKILSEFQKKLSNAQAHDESLRREMLNQEGLYYGALKSQHQVDLKPSSEWQDISEWLKTWNIPQAWQKIVDWLWAQFLPQYYLKHLNDIEAFSELPKSYYAVMQNRSTSKNLLTLLEFMQLDSMPSGFLDWQKIYVTDTFADAKKRIQNLNPDESILCQEGIWLGKNWIYHLPLDQDKQIGLATRLQNWQNAVKVYDSYQTEYIEIKKEFEGLQKNHEHARFDLDTQTKAYQEQLRLEAIHQNKFENLQQQYRFLLQEQERQQIEFEKAQTQYAQAIEKNQNCKQKIDENHRLLEELTLEESKILEILEALQTQHQCLESDFLQLQNQFNEQKLIRTRLQIQKDYLQDQLPIMQTQLQNMQNRLIEIEASLKQIEEKDNQPINSLTLMEKNIEASESLLSQALQKIEKMKLERFHLFETLETMNKQHLQALEKKWKLSAEQEQNSKSYQEISQQFQRLSKDLWKSLNPEENEKFLKKNIQDLEFKMQQLGDVNLLAIGLFTQEQERLSKLLLQESDLKQAIDELENAIKTLDEDMQKRLQETLLAINHHLTEIFPLLFGGGQAKFVASCDNLLEATVSVEVQAPGKKQHRIQLLSGGEKALTAVALLFSIFSLNPAPFCLLDEVDAALDDANAQRLGNLIHKLSSTVQFVLITHNPLTMDVADELIGVTMQEPGVSRVVSVNMAMALEMVNKE
jgi:chromosome segregation protein